MLDSFIRLNSSRDFAMSSPSPNTLTPDPFTVRRTMYGSTNWPVSHRGCGSVGVPERSIEHLRRLQQRARRPVVSHEPIEQVTGHQHDVPGAVADVAVGHDAIVEDALPERVHPARPLQVLADDAARLLGELRRVCADRDDVLAAVVRESVRQLAALPSA